MSDLELLQLCINRLNNILLPVGLIDEIGAPIKQVSRDLENLKQAIIAEIQKETEKNEKVIELKPNKEETEHGVDDLSEAGEREGAGGMPGGEI